MLIWDFNVIVALAITVGLGVVITLWLVYTLSRGRVEIDRQGQYFRQCGFCGFLYFDYFRKEHAACPRCKSRG